MARIAVVGANGRVGAAVCDRLRARHDVVEIGRLANEAVEELATRATSGVDGLINAAGVAHIEHPTPADLERLSMANFELPLALAAASLERSISMVHISSVKAVPNAPTPYGRSKFDAERALQARFGRPFADRNLSMVILRPLALLFPPLDAGRVAKLRFLRRWPAALTPPIRVPVVAPDKFLNAVLVTVEDQLTDRAERGVVVREFDREGCGNLRDVRAAMRRDEEMRRRPGRGA